MFSTTSTCLSWSSNVHMFCSYSLSLNMRVGTQLMNSWLSYDSILLLKLCVASDDVTINHPSNDE